MAVDVAAARAQLARLQQEKSNSGGQGDIKWINMPDDGSIKMRVLPPLKGHPLPGKVVYMHYGIPEKKACKCMKTWDKPCAICQFLEQYSHIESIMDEYATVPKTIIPVLAVGHPDFDPKTPILFSASGDYNYIWLLDQILNDNVGDITDPIYGHDIEYRRTKHKGSIDRTIVLKPRPIVEDLSELPGILAAIPDIDKMYVLDDDHYRYMNECLALLEGAIKLQLNSRPAPPPANSTPYVPPVPPQQSAAPATVATVMNTEVHTDTYAGNAAPINATVVTPPTAGAAPAVHVSGKPQCFGQYNNTNTVCFVCPEELSCEAATCNGSVAPPLIEMTPAASFPDDDLPF